MLPRRHRIWNLVETPSPLTQPKFQIWPLQSTPWHYSHCLDYYSQNLDPKMWLLEFGSKLRVTCQIWLADVVDDFYKSSFCFHFHLCSHFLFQWLLHGITFITFICSHFFFNCRQWQLHASHITWRGAKFCFRYHCHFQWHLQVIWHQQEPDFAPSITFTFNEIYKWYDVNRSPMWQAPSHFCEPVHPSTGAYSIRVMII